MAEHDLEDWLENGNDLSECDSGGPLDREDRIRATVRRVLTAHNLLAKTFLALAPPAVENEHLRFVAFEGHENAGQIGAWIIESTCRILRQQIEAGPEEKRNRITIGMTWDEGVLWNLTLARGSYESVMEAQRDQARAQRDELLRAQAEILGKLTVAEAALAAVASKPLAVTAPWCDACRMAHAPFATGDGTKGAE